MNTALPLVKFYKPVVQQEQSMDTANIEKLLKELAAPFGRDGVVVDACIEFKTIDGDPRFSLYIMEREKGGCKIVYSQHVRRFDEMRDVLKQARECGAEVAAKDQRETAQLAAVLGIPYPQAAE